MNKGRVKEANSRQNGQKQISQGVTNYEQIQSSSQQAQYGQTLNGLKKLRGPMDISLSSKKVIELKDEDIDFENYDEIPMTIAKQQSANFKQGKINTGSFYSGDKFDIQSSQYGSLNPSGVNQNTYLKQSTTDYPIKNNFQGNSLGKPMDHISELVSFNKRSAYHSESVEEEAADIDDSIAEIQTDEDQSMAIKTVQNAMKMGTSYKKEATKNYESSQYQNMKLSVNDIELNDDQIGDSRENLVTTDNESIEVPLTPKQLYVSQIQRNSVLSLTELNDYINQHHPKKFDKSKGTYKDWSLNKSMPSLTNCCQKRKIPKISKSIGLGASLFLITLKAYIRLFLIVTLFSIPSALLIQGGYAGKYSEQEGSSVIVTQEGGVVLDGIVAKQTIACAKGNVAQDLRKLEMKCPQGTMSRVVSVGINKKIDQDICTSSSIQVDSFTTITSSGAQFENVSITELPADQQPGAKTYQNFADYNKNCSTFFSSDLQNSTFILSLLDSFDLSCFGQSSCSIPYDYGIMPYYCIDEVLKRAFASFYPDLYENNYDPANKNIKNFDRQSTYRFDQNVSEPVLFLTAECSYKESVIKEVESSQTQEKEEAKIGESKNRMNFLVVINDIFLISILVLGFNIIGLRQKEYIKAYKEQNVETRGFTLEIDQLPGSFSQHKSILCMKFAIWKQIQAQLALCKQEGKCSADLDPTIIEIAFITSDVELSHMMLEITDLLVDIEQSHANIIRVQSLNRRFIKNAIISLAKEAITNKVNTLHYKLDILKLKYSEQLGVKPPNIKQEEIDEIDELTVKKEATRFFESINKVYITFTCMQTRNVVERLFPAKEWNKMCRVEHRMTPEKREIKLNVYDEDKPEVVKGTGPLYIAQKPKGQEVYYVDDLMENKDKPIQVKHAKCNPEMINWANMGKQHWVTRVCSSFAVIIGCLGLTVLLFWIFQQHQFLSYRETSDYLDMSRSCSSNYTMREAYDFIGVADNKIPCFCHQQYNYNFSNYFDINFNEYNKKVKQGQIDDSNQALKIEYENKIEIQRLQSLSQEEGKPEHFQQSSNGTTQKKVDPIEKPTYKPDYVSTETLTEYCDIWLKNYMVGIALENGPQQVINVLNDGFLVPVVLGMSFMQRHWSSDQQTLTVFIVSSFVWICNIGIILVVALAYKPGFLLFDTKDQTAGSTIGLALFTLFAPQLFINGMFYLYYVHKRFKDRGYRRAMNSGELGSDEVFSANFSHKTKLNSLYTGKPFCFGLVQAHITTIIFVTLMYSGGMPVLYPLCVVFLMMIYFYSKLVIFKFCQIPYDITDSLVVGANRFLGLALVAHFIISWQMFKNSDEFSNDFALEDTQTPHEQIYVKLFLFFTAYQTPERNIHDYKIVELYLDFCIFALVFFAVNIFVINPATICFRCFTKKDSLEHNYSSGSTDQSVKIQSCFSKVEQHEHKVPSNDYYAEANIRTLKHHYSNTIENILLANTRLQLYFRIAKINEDSQMGIVFTKKYDNFYPYYQSWVDNKTRIEHQIDLHFKQQNLAIEMDRLERDIIDHESINIKEDLDSPAHSERQGPDLETVQLRRELGLKPKLTFVPQSQNLGLDGMGNINMNKLINTLQTQSTLVIQSEEALFARILGNQTSPYFKKLALLPSGQITQSYSFAAKYPDLKECIAHAEMLIEDPYLDEILKK